jgi:hypothetical protein
MFKHDSEWRRKNLERQRRWCARHPDKVRARKCRKKPTSRLRKDRPCCFIVYELVADNVPHYVGIRRNDHKAPWLRVWQHRLSVGLPLALWFRTLAQRPIERCIRGQSLALPLEVARALCKHRVKEISQMAGTWPSRPGFLCNVVSIQPGGGNSRPVLFVGADGVRQFASRTEAARVLGVTRKRLRDLFADELCGWYG